MQTLTTKPTTIDQYIAGFPSDVQKLLQQLRSTIKKLAPDAEEIISYGMPAFKWNGLLVWMAGYKHHIGFYPGSAPVTAFQNELTNYKWAKGSVQFPLNQPLPLPLINKLLTFKKKENLEKATAKLLKKKIRKP